MESLGELVWFLFKVLLILLVVNIAMAFVAGTFLSGITERALFNSHKWEEEVRERRLEENVCNFLGDSSILLRRQCSSGGVVRVRVEAPRIAYRSRCKDYLLREQDVVWFNWRLKTGGVRIQMSSSEFIRLASHSYRSRDDMLAWGADEVWIQDIDTSPWQLECVMKTLPLWRVHLLGCVRVD